MMANVHLDSVVNFDLNLLQSSTTDVTLQKVPHPDKQRQSILNVKKKIVASNALLQKFYKQREKLEETESQLLAAKEECRQACIDYNVTYEKYTELEKETVKLRLINQDLAKNVSYLDNEVEAMKSHTCQLQSLVKQSETEIAGLKLEKQLEKSSEKEFHKKLASFERERETYLRDIRWLRDVILKKKKLNQIQDILNKYEDEKENCEVSDNSCDEGNFDDSPIGSPVHQILNKEVKIVDDEVKVNAIKNSNEYGTTKLKEGDIVEDYENYDYCNEIVSEDTGRGSSLALSDKFINSPDVDNEVVDKCVEYVDVATSPITIVEEHIIPSPVHFDDEALLCEKNVNDITLKSPEYFVTDIPFSNEIVTIKEKPQLIDACTSPVHQTVDMENKCTSPINFSGTNDKLVDNCNGSAVHNMSFNTLSINSELEIEKKSQENKYFEKENSKQPVCDRVTDCEVEMILNRMRLQHKAISPIPRRMKDYSRKNKEELHKETVQQHNSCSEALKVREENKALQANVDNLCKEIMLIKSLLINKNSYNLANQIENMDHFATVDNCLKNNNSIVPSKNLDNVIPESMTINEDSNISDFDAAHEVENDPISLISIDKSPQHKSQRNTSSSDVDLQQHQFEESLGIPEDDNVLEILHKEKNCDIVTDINYLQRTSDHLRRCKYDLSQNAFSARSKPRKLTKLDRFKKKVISKSKIKAVSISPNRKIKRVPLVPFVKKDVKNKPMEILKNKEAYNKALKLMVELKSQKKSNIRTFRRKIAKQTQVQTSKTTDIKKKVIENKSCDTNSKDTTTLKDTQEGNETNVLLIQNKKYPDYTPLKYEHNISKLTSHEQEAGLKRKSDKIIDLNPPSNDCAAVQENNNNDSVQTMSLVNTDENDTVNPSKTKATTRRRKRLTSDSFNISCKRLLRSSKTNEKSSNEKRSLPINYDDLELFTSAKENINKSSNDKENSDSDTSMSQSLIKKRKLRERPSLNFLKHSSNRLLRSTRSSENKNLSLNSENLDTEPAILLNNEEIQKEEKIGKSQLSELSRERLGWLESGQTTNSSVQTQVFSNSVICKMINKYGKNIVKTSACKVSDKIRNSVCERIDKTLTDIIDIPSDKIQLTLDNLAEDLKRFNRTGLIAGIMKHLQDPARKLELHNKVTGQVPMTKNEHYTLYVIRQLNTTKCNMVNEVLANIEFALFCLNKSPNFDTIESLSHFYAVICRIFHLKNRLRTFLLDAMYCLNFKALPLIKQCLSTWSHVLPLAHMLHAKSPLVQCIVYLLHFYQCDQDKLNRVGDLRWILNKKYFYDFNDWNQAKILEMISDSIKTIKDEPAEMNMLRIAMILFAKRQGVKWCQKNFINNLLLPIIENENSSKETKIFCIKLLGPLLKPYPSDMKVHSEIVLNKLLNMVDNDNLSHDIKEAVFTSLIYMSRQNPSQVLQALMHWQPPTITPQLENLLKAYVQEKPIKAWKHFLLKAC
ncbi:unnamed protein product [Leptosia nina]|uniref:Uncharacterized protein n=1 Tax=Leptosia nina TaxID=320188 RepID=A0AAV1JM35_9NEOP